MNDDSKLKGPARRERIKQDSQKILDMLKNLINEGIDSAPDELIDRSDGFMLVTGALQALEIRWLEVHGLVSEEDVLKKLGVSAPRNDSDKKKLFN